MSAFTWLCAGTAIVFGALLWRSAGLVAQQSYKIEALRSLVRDYAHLSGKDLDQAVESRIAERKRKSG